MLNVQRNQIVLVTKHAWQIIPVEHAILIINVEAAKNVRMAGVLNVSVNPTAQLANHAWQTTPVEAVLKMSNVEEAKSV